jgi:rare lipoprotein A
MRMMRVLAATAACALLGAYTTAQARDSEFYDATANISRTARASLVTNQRAVTTAARGSFAGRASYYAHPGRTASGGRFNPHGLTAAHRSLPFGTKLRVSDPRSGRSVVVTVNDRGPFTGGRVLDLSLGAARVLGMTQRGVMHVRAERI